MTLFAYSEDCCVKSLQKNLSNGLSFVYESALFDAFDIGLVSFSEARELQNEFVRCRIDGRCKKDVILFCEHYPTISLGSQSLCAEDNKDFLVDLDYIRHKGIEIVKTDRGGLATFHGHGQVVIYPVVSLRNIKCGVKIFISEVLEVIVSIARSFGVDAYKQLAPAGVWVGELYPRKLCSVGLRVMHGVTNHGFSFNISNELWPYELFVPCGLREVGVTNLLREVSSSDQVTHAVANDGISCARIVVAFCEMLNERFLVINV